MSDNPAMLGQAQGVNKNLADLTQVMRTAFPLHSATGSFTLDAAATTNVVETSIKADSMVIPMPTNAAAATLMGGDSSLYISSRTAGIGFSVTTADGGAAAGTETFEFLAVSIG
jgi:hypothetical protein